MKGLVETICLSVLMLIIVGCSTQKETLYLQDLEKEEILKITTDYDVKITYDDLIGITVHSRNPELTVPFTIQTGTSAGSGSSYGSSAASRGAGNKGIEYLVDSEGNIDFPILGKLHVAGMTRMEISEYIKNRLIEEDYIKDPIVIVRLLNFKVTIFGDVNNPNVVNVNTDRITIFEALTQAGDLAFTGRRNKVTVIRETDGVRVPYYLDLRSKDVFSSPCYYLQQNDLVYIEPNKYKLRNSNNNQFKNVTTWTSLISFLMSMSTLIFVSK